MKNLFKIFSLLVSFVLLSANAQEVAGSKEIVEINKKIIVENAKMKSETSKFKNIQASNVQNIKAKLESLKEVVAKSKEAEEAFNIDSSEVNQEIYLSSREDLTEARAVVVNAFTDSVLYKSEYAENVAQRYFDISVLCEKLAKLYEKSGNGVVDADIMLQMRTNIIASGNLTKAIAKDVPDSYKKEADNTMKLIVSELSSPVAKSGSANIDKLKSLSNLCKDYAATMARTRAYLDEHKANIAYATLNTYLNSFLSDPITGFDVTGIETSLQTESDLLEEFVNTSGSENSGSIDDDSSVSPYDLFDAYLNN